MNKGTKKQKSYLILIIGGIIAFIIVLIFLLPEKDKIIQGELIVILICITGFYAIQTQDLVRQEEKYLDDEKKRRAADFAIKKLHEFYSPLISLLLDLEIHLEKRPISIPSIKKELKELNYLQLEYFYFIDLQDPLYSLSSHLRKFRKIISKEKKVLQKWISKALNGIKETQDHIDIRTIVFKKLIIEVFGYFDKEMMDSLEK